MPWLARHTLAALLALCALGPQYALASLGRDTTERLLEPDSHALTGTRHARHLHLTPPLGEPLRWPESRLGNYDWQLLRAEAFSYARNNPVSYTDPTGLAGVPGTESADPLAGLQFETPWQYEDSYHGAYLLRADYDLYTDWVNDGTARKGAVAGGLLGITAVVGATGGAAPELAAAGRAAYAVAGRLSLEGSARLYLAGGSAATGTATYADKALSLGRRALGAVGDAPSKAYLQAQGAMERFSAAFPRLGNLAKNLADSIDGAWSSFSPTTEVPGPKSPAWLIGNVTHKAYERLERDREQ